MKIFALRDRKAEVYKTVFTLDTTVDAIRGFESAVNDPKTTYGRYPDDFSLYLMGEVDFSNGRFTIMESPQEIAYGRDLVASNS